MSENSHRKELPATPRVLISLAAGAIAGAAAKSSIAPLDRCKISFQINNERYSTRAAILYLKDVYQKQGLLAMWRGNSATMARILPYASIQFTSHDQWKRVLGISNLQTDQNSKDVKIRRFLAGSLAGVTSQSITYPLDLARARMAVTHDDTYSSLKKVFRITWKNEGVRGFYRGYVPTILGVIPYAGASFFTYETLKLWYSDSFQGETAGTMERLAFGAAAGICGQSVSYPLDIVRRRMQTAFITGRHYDSILQSLVRIYREEGIVNGYFKGLSMNWIKGPIAAGISFATYDLTKDLFTEILLRRS